MATRREMREAIEAGDEKDLGRMLSERGLFGRRMAKAEGKAFSVGEEMLLDEAWKRHTMLMLAARKGQAGPARKLVEAGADVEARDKEGLTALMWAGRAGNAETVGALLRAGAERGAGWK